MKLKYKALALIIIMSLCVISVTKESFATTKQNIIAEKMSLKTLSILPVNDEKIFELGDVSIKKEILIGNKHIPLLKTFDKPDVAIKKIKANPIIRYVLKTGQINEVNKNNTQEVMSSVCKLLNSDNCPDWIKNDSESIYNIECFVDIMENEEQNLRVESIIKKKPDLYQLLSDEEFVELLPEESELKLYEEGKMKNNIKKLDAKTYKGFDIDKGVIYAKNFATVRNENKYGSFGEDCTNFMSQILEYGGVDQVTNKTNDETKGWWHKKINGKHKYSISWIQANTFAKYMGVKYRSKSLNEFSVHIARGDFIAVDWTSDGKWDHMGFITQKGKWNGKYYDFQIAQHSSDYIAWVSSEENSWDINKYGIYGRVRR